MIRSLNNNEVIIDDEMLDNFEFRSFLTNNWVNKTRQFNKDNKEILEKYFNKWDKDDSDENFICDKESFLTEEEHKRFGYDFQLKKLCYEDLFSQKSIVHTVKETSDKNFRCSSPILPLWCINNLKKFNETQNQCPKFFNGINVPSTITQTSFHHKIGLELEDLFFTDDLNMTVTQCDDYLNQTITNEKENPPILVASSEHLNFEESSKVISSEEKNIIPIKETEDNKENLITLPDKKVKRFIPLLIGNYSPAKTKMRRDPMLELCKNYKEQENVDASHSKQNLQAVKKKQAKTRPIDQMKRMMDEKCQNDEI
jgi:hypothetical protein